MLTAPAMSRITRNRMKTRPSEYPPAHEELNAESVRSMNVAQP